jgi:hypothetical protein
MPQDVTLQVYRFSELTGKARERAKDWWIECSGHITSDQIHQMLIERLFEAGYPTLSVEFSLSWRQGDGVAFYTDCKNWQPEQAKHSPWRYLPESYRTRWVDLRRLWRTRIRSQYKKDDRRRMYQLMAAGMTIGISIAKNSYGHHYSHYNTMAVSVEIQDWPDAGTKEVEALVKDFEETIQADVKELSKELEAAGYKEIEHQTSDENVTADMESNEILFHADGRVFHE